MRKINTCFKNIFGVCFQAPLPLFRRRFRSQRRNEANVKREVPAAVSPIARGALDSVGARETEREELSQKELNLKSFCSVHLPFPLHTDELSTSIHTKETW